jgi:hypothetical protein
MRERQRPSDRVVRYWVWLKTLPCAACNKHGLHTNPIEAAHVRGIYSERLRSLSHRSHLGLQGWAALPLCKACHTSLHEWGEQRFLETRVGHPHARITTNVLRFLLEEDVMEEERDEHRVKG